MATTHAYALKYTHHSKVSGASKCFENLLIYRKGEVLENFKLPDSCPLITDSMKVSLYQNK